MYPSTGELRYAEPSRAVPGTRLTLSTPIAPEIMSMVVKPLYLEAAIPIKLQRPRGL